MKKLLLLLLIIPAFVYSQTDGYEYIRNKRTGYWDLVNASGTTTTGAAEYFVNGNYTGTTQDGSFTRPYKTIQKAMEYINADAAAKALAGNYPASKYVLKVAPGTYSDSVVFTNEKYLRVEMAGVIISGAVHINTTQQTGDYYSKLEFVGGMSNRPEKGDNGEISGVISCTRNNDALTYLSFTGMEISNNLLFTVNGTWVVFLNHAYFSNGSKFISGDFSGGGTPTVLIESMGMSRIKAHIADTDGSSTNVSLYDCMDTEFDLINSHSTFGGVLRNCLFVSNVTISAGTYKIDNVSYKQIVAQTENLTGATIQYMDDTFGGSVTIADNLNVTDTIKIGDPSHELMILDDGGSFVISKGDPSVSGADALSISNNNISLAADSTIVGLNNVTNMITNYGNVTNTKNTNLGDDISDITAISGRLGINCAGYFSKLVVVGTSVTGDTKNMCNFVDGSLNKNRSTYVQATDTSSNYFRYTPLGKLEWYIKSHTGIPIFSIDSTQGASTNYSFLFNENSANYTRGNTLNAFVNINANSNTTTLSLRTNASSSSTGGANLQLGVQDGAIMATGDRVGSINFWGGTGATGAANCAKIEVFADGAWSSSNDHPGRLVLSTKLDGTSSYTERVIIRNNGVIGTTPVNTGEITAGTGIIVSMLSQDMRYNGTSAINITANPQIVAGNDGDVIELTGLSDVNTLTLDDGTGLQLQGGISFVLGSGDVICLKYVASLNVWVEKFRSDN